MTWARTKAMLVGIEHQPAVVAAARALVFYALPLLVQWLPGFFAGLPPQWSVVLLAEMPLIRLAEGAILDQLHKPTQNAAVPAPPAGVSPAPSEDAPASP